MELIEFLKTRRTYRRFEQREIADSIIDEMLLAATYASSAANCQPLSYIVIRSKAMTEAVFPMTYWARYLAAEQGRPKKTERPVLFVAVVQNMDISKTCDIDVGLAISNMTLTAWKYGVGSCIIGAFEREKLSEIFSLSDSQILHTMVAFGYPSHKSRLADIKDGDVKYYLDENGDYVVPKRRMEDIVRYL